MDNCKVAYEEWQYACCGVRFTVGDKIKWLVIDYGQVTGVMPPDIVTQVGQIDYFYEAHSSDWKNISVLTGTVQRIQGLYYRYGSVPGQRALVPLSGSIVDLQNCDAADSIEDLRLAEYIVELTDCDIRPAKEADITFR